MTPEPIPGYLTSEEAAQALGVKRATLYTYVSRGLIRIAPAAGGKRRLYLASDVAEMRTRSDAHRGHAAAAASSMGWGPPILESAITSIDPTGPTYRGHVATTLAETEPFEAVAALLWTGSLDGPAGSLKARDLGLRPEDLRAIVAPGTPPLEALAVLVPALAAADPLRHAATDQAQLLTAGRLVRRMVAALALTRPDRDWKRRIERALRAPTIPRAVGAALGASPAGDDLVRRALVVCADHELNASTFAARVTASTGADLHACVGAALAALSGPRHGGQNDRVEALLDEAGDASGVPRALGDRFRRGDPVPGFGHRLYPDGDPRAVALLGAIDTQDSEGRIAALLAVVRHMREAGHAPPNLDVGLVACCAAAGLPRGSAAGVFAIGRCVGWIAHAREQAATGELLRPRARYVGP